MRIQIAAATLFFANAVTAATFAPYNPLTHVRYGTAAITARVNVASNGRGFVALWQTSRDQRVARVGGVELNVGVPVGQGRGLGAIAASGDRYVVAATSPQGLQAVFVNEAANVIGEAIPVEAAASVPRVAAYGDVIGLVYLRASDAGTDLESALLSRTGSIIKKNITLIANWYVSRETYDIAASAAGVAIATSSSANGVRVMILDTSGNVVSTTLIDQPWSWNEPPFDVAIASDGHGYVVLWTARDGTLRAASLDSSGAVLQTANVATPKPPQPLYPPNRIARPAIAFDGLQYVCSYLDGYVSTYSTEVFGFGYVTRIDPSPLTISTAPALQTADRVIGITVSAASGSSMVVWADSIIPGNEIADAGDLRAAMLTADGFGDAFPIAIAASEQLSPAAASNGSETLVVWNEPVWIPLIPSQWRSADTIMYGLIDDAGRWRPIGPVAPQRAQAPVVVASNGSDFLVVWQGGAVRLTSDGIPLDPQPLVLTPSLTPTSAVWDGQRYVIAGNIYPAAAVVVIDPSGAVGDVHVVRPSKNGDSVSDPMLVWSGSAFLITFVWREPPCGDLCSTGTGAHALPLTAAFEPGTEFPIGPTDAILSTAVAWNGSEFLAAVINYWTPFATRISSDGKSLGTVPLGTSAKLEKLGRPSITLNGTDFLVAWRALSSAPANNYLVEVHPDGSVSDLTVIDTAVETSEIVLLDVAGRQLLVSSRVVDEAPYYGASRVTIQTTNATTPGTAPKLTAVSDGAVFTLQWTPVANATEYRIEYRTGNDPWSELDIPPSLATSLTVRARSNLVRHDFRVRGWNADGTSPYSNAVSVVLPRRRAM